MRIFFLGFFFVISNTIFSQNIYHFDYMLEYDYVNNDLSRATKQFILANSKDNSYSLTLTSNDSLNFELFFLDQKGNRSRTSIMKYDFFRSDAIRIPCKYNERFFNPYKYQVKNYSFTIDNDTLIGSESYYKYSIKSDDLKRAQNKKLYSYHYIIKKGTENYLPLFTHMTPYEEWKLEKNIPNGIPYIVFYKNHKGFVDSSFKLKKMTPISKAIYVSNECDFSRK